MRNLYEATGGKPQRWESLDNLGAVKADAAGIAYAVERGWLRVSGGLHSLSLTELHFKRPEIVRRKVAPQGRFRRDRFSIEVKDDPAVAARAFGESCVWSSAFQAIPGHRHSSSWMRVPRHWLQLLQGTDFLASSPPTQDDIKRAPIVAQPNKPSPARAARYRGLDLLGQEKCVDVHAYAPSCDCHGYQDHQGRIEAHHNTSSSSLVGEHQAAVVGRSEHGAIGRRPSAC
jgi:hypothetical protein